MVRGVVLDQGGRFPATLLAQKTKIVHGKDWRDVDKDEKKLIVVVTRIHCLSAAGLTIEMVGTDSLRWRIGPLQNKGRLALEFKNAADITKFHPGLNNNLTTL